MDFYEFNRWAMAIMMMLITLAVAAFVFAVAFSLIMDAWRNKK